MQSKYRRYSYSILAYLDSMLVRDLLAKAMGHSFCVRAAPNPYSLVLVWMMIGCCLLK